MKFRKKPVVVEAMRWRFVGATLVPQDAETLRWSEEKAANTDRTISLRNGSIFIDTLEGEMEARPGDWIICGVEGELYPCKPDIFAKTYEAAE